VLLLFFLIAIHNFLILKHDNGRDMLMTRMTSIILILFISLAKIKGFCLL
jgi:hypothetical protein